MATIVTRRRADGSTGYTARIRIRKGREVIYRETETFSTKTAAKAWAKGREVELEHPEALALAQCGDVSLAAIIKWYRETFGEISGWQRSKESALKFLENHEIGKADVLKLTSEILVEHVRRRRLSGVKGQTVANDLIWIGVVLETAKAARGLRVNPAVVEEARLVCKKLRLICRSTKRDRRPTNEELQKLDQHFFHRDRHACSIIPMRTIMWFAIYSCRREAEICRIEWGDNDAVGRTGVVRDAKHPRNKLGNHRRFKYTPEAWDIVQQQPKRGPYIFPYAPRSISSAFTEACAILGIEDLHFHDLRHEATSRLFELGYDIHEVAQFSLHTSWDELKRYANLRPETLREIIRLQNGETVIRAAPVKLTTLPCPPAGELAPPTGRPSRSPLFIADPEQ
jgi:integrase